MTTGTAHSEAGWEQILVMGQGLPAWMDAWPHMHASRSAPTSATISTTPFDPDLALTALQRSQLAQVLAGMILHSRPEVPS